MCCRFIYNKVVSIAKWIVSSNDKLNGHACIDAATQTEDASDNVVPKVDGFSQTDQEDYEIHSHRFEIWSDWSSSESSSLA
jgi:homoserine kinase